MDGGRPVEHGGERPLLPDGADPADEVSGTAFGVGRVCQGCAFAAELPGECFQVQLTINRDDRHHESLVCSPIRLCDKGFEDAFGRDAERGRGLEAVRLRAPIVLELMSGEVDAGPAQRERRGRSGGRWMTTR